MNLLQFRFQGLQMEFELSDEGFLPCKDNFKGGKGKKPKPIK